MSILRHHARLMQRRVQTPQLVSLRLEVPSDLLEKHEAPGQFVEVGFPDDPARSFFAIANRPGETTLELLVKRAEGLPERLWALRPGDPILLSDPRGPGFPVEEARGRDVLLFATGSGFAPIRATLQEITGEREAYGDVHLFFGVRTEEDIPFKEELIDLRQAGVEVHLTISRKPEPAPGHGRYVQERFLAILPPVKSSVAFLCGIEGMVEGVTKALLRAGLPAERVHVNV